MNFIALTCVLCLVAGPQQEDQGEGPAAAAQTPARADAPPTLDELLGLDSDDTGASAAEQAARENARELDRRLREVEISDLFVLALERMATSARMLEEALDTGLGTQRVQLDALAKLDQLIDIARELSAQQMGSPGSSGGSPRQAQPKPGPQQRAAGGQRRDTGDQSGMGSEPPPGRSGDINTILQETESEWGHLPQRIREMMQQGRKGDFSILYRKLTEDYYKRLAEER